MGSGARVNSSSRLGGRQLCARGGLGWDGGKVWGAGRGGECAFE